MANGTIVRLQRDRGFGFIKVDDNGRAEDVFFHRSALANVAFEGLTEGQPVTFDMGQSPKGVRAENVRVPVGTRVAATDKLLAEWFWTDRWIGSSAFGLPLEARGLYREMLTQAWRRGARLPNDPDQVRRMTGVTPSEWRRTWPLVERFWRVDGDTLVNDTQVEIYTDAAARTQRASKRGLSGAQALHKQRVGSAQAVLKHQPPSLSPSPSPEEKQKISAEPETGSSPVLTFPTVGLSPTWNLSLPQLVDWEGLFPNLDVLAQCREALAWVKAKPSRRKTGRGMPAFLVGWFTRSNDRGGQQVVTQAGYRPVPEKAAWRDDCQASRHEPPCETQNHHELRLQIAEKGCTHPGVCRSFGEHAQRSEKSQVAS